MSRGQHHKGLAVATAGGLLLALVLAIGGIAMPPGETLWHLVAAPDEDGSWRFLTIDGIDVSAERYSVGIRWGEITGYYDGCNSCGIGDGDGRQGIYHQRTCTLAACEERPYDQLFRRFLVRGTRMDVSGDRMVMSVPGHRAVLVRQVAD